MKDGLNVKDSASWQRAASIDRWLTLYHQPLSLFLCRLLLKAQHSCVCVCVPLISLRTVWVIGY